MAPFPIIHLNGFPGTGKLTIAKYLVDIFLTSDHAKLVHNHLLINPADAILHRTQPGYQVLRRALRQAVFTSLAENPATYETVYVFTDFQSTSEVGSAVCEEFANAAEKARGSAFIPVVLKCAEEVNVERLIVSERGAHGKLMDTDLLRLFRAGAPVYRFDENPAFLELDVTNIAPRDAAKIIFDHVLAHCPEVKQLFTV